MLNTVESFNRSFFRLIMQKYICERCIKINYHNFKEDFKTLS